ncbi:MAG: hypothetical protein WD772_11975, partial [Pseudohongiellaceae bacterium]
GSQTCRLVNAEVCGDFFTLLEVSVINDEKRGWWSAKISRQKVLILPAMVGRKAHCQLRRHLRFSAWCRAGEAQASL